MTITIDVPENLVREAETLGLSVDAHIQEQLRTLTTAEYERRGFTRFGNETRTASEAVDSIIENRKKLTRFWLTSFLCESSSRRLSHSMNSVR